MSLFIWKRYLYVRIRPIPASQFSIVVRLVSCLSQIFNPTSYNSSSSFRKYIHSRFYITSNKRRSNDDRCNVRDRSTPFEGTTDGQWESRFLPPKPWRVENPILVSGARLRVRLPAALQDSFTRLIEERNKIELRYLEIMSIRSTSVYASCRICPKKKKSS